MKRLLIWAPTAVSTFVAVVAAEVALFSPGVGTAENVAAFHALLAAFLGVMTAVSIEATR